MSGGAPIALPRETLIAIRDALEACWTPALGESLARDAASNAAQGLCEIAEGDTVDAALRARLEMALQTCREARGGDRDAQGRLALSSGDRAWLALRGAAAIGQVFVNALRAEAARAAVCDALAVIP